MFHYSNRQTVERSDQVVEEGEKKELQKESGNLSEDKQDFASGSMLAIGDTMAVTSDPENSGSEQSSEEEFVFLPMPPQFVPGHLEYLEDALMCHDLPTAYQAEASDDSSSDDSGGDHSNECNKKHGSRNDPSDNCSHDDHVNDIYNNNCVILQQQEMHTGDFHLQILQSKLEDNYTKVVEGSGKAVQGEEVQEEDHKEYDTRSQWKDQESPSSGSTLVDGVTISASKDPEIGVANEQSSNEDIFEVQDNLSLIPSPALVERVEPGPCPRCCSYFCFPCFCW